MSFVATPPEVVALPIVGTDMQFTVRRVYCVGRNYAAHAREMGFDPDREPPFFFCKPADAIRVVVPGQTLELKYPLETSNQHYEIQLVAAIGKAGKNIEVNDDLSHESGYECGPDSNESVLKMKMRADGRERKS